MVSVLRPAQLQVQKQLAEAMNELNVIRMEVRGQMQLPSFAAVGQESSARSRQSKEDMRVAEMSSPSPPPDSRDAIWLLPPLRPQIQTPSAQFAFEERNSPLESVAPATEVIADARKANSAALEERKSGADLVSESILERSYALYRRHQSSLQR